MSDSAQTPPAAPPSRLRRVLRWASWIGLGAAGVLLVVGIILRLYYDDERIRDLTLALLDERLDAEVELREVETSIFGTVELRGVRIGPLPGFERDTLRFDRVAVRWSMLQLLILNVVLEEVAVEGLHGGLEERGGTTNIDALLTALAPPGDDAEPEEEPEPEVEEETGPLEQPSIPVDIEVQDLHITDLSGFVDTPALVLEVDRFGVHTEATAGGDEYDAEIWVGLGARDDAGAPAHISLSLPDSATTVEADTRLAIELDSTGFGDINLGIGLTIDADVRAPDPLPPTRLEIGLDAAADLFAQRADVRQLTVRVGDGTVLAIQGGARELLGPLAIEVRQVQLDSILAELSPVLAAFLPESKLAGELHLAADPVQTSLAALDSPDQVPAALRLQLVDAAFHLGDLKVDAISLDTTAAIDAGDGEVILGLGVGDVRVAGQRFRDARLDVRARSPLRPYLGGEHTGLIDADLTLTVASAGSAAGRGERVRVGVKAGAPVAMILDGDRAEPLTGTVQIDIGRATSPTASLWGLDLELTTSTQDLAFDFSRSRLALEIAGAEVVAEHGVIPIGETRLDLTARRSGFDDFRVAPLALDVGGLVRLEVRGAVNDAFGPRPRFDELAVTLTPVKIENVLAILPEAMRPPGSVSGSIGLAVEVDGTLPHVELARLAQPPAVPEGSEDDITVVMAGWGDYVQRWSDRVSAGFPFDARITAEIEDVDFAADGVDVEGVTSTTQLELRPTGPRIVTTLAVDTLREPVVAAGVATKSEFEFARGEVGFGVEGGVERLEQAGAPPLEGATVATSFTYKVGGDLLLDRFDLTAPNRGMAFEMSGVLIKPLRAILTQGWRRPGLPGVEAELRWRGQLHHPELMAIAPDAPKLVGRLSLASSIVLRDGVATLAGLFDTEQVSVDLGDTIVEELSGSLPFELALAFDPRDDATVLPYDLGLGSGVLAIFTSADDVRTRPARPTYYSRLRPYRERKGLRIRSIVSGPFEVFDLELDGRLDSGTLVADHLALGILGGDVLGNMALQLGRDAEIIADLSFKFSNLDASNFSQLELEAGPDSELSADLRAGALFAAQRRDLTLNMNVTKIGVDTLDRFLQLLDPEGTNGDIQDTRGNLGLIRIEEVAVWVRFEILRLDIAYRALPILTIPFTDIGYRPIDRENLRRQKQFIGDRLDTSLQPAIDAHLAPLLGWVKR